MPRAGVMLAIVLLVGCQGGDADLPPAESDAPAVAQWGSTVDWSVGGDEEDGSGTLYRVYSAFLDGEGGLFLAHGGEAEVRKYEAPGLLVRTVGRSGPGPGEFLRLRWVGELDPGHLLAFDARLGRFSAFDEDGELDHMFAVPVEEHGEIRWMGSSGDGYPLLLAVSTGLDPRTFEGTARDSVRLVRADSGAAEPIRDAPALPDRTWRRADGPNAFGLERVESAPSALLARRGDEVWISDSASNTVRVVTTEGSTDSVRLRVPDERASRRRSSAERRWDQMVISHSGGEIWLSVAAIPGDTRPWLVFDPGGTLLAEMELPADARLLQVREDRAVLRRVDSLGVEKIEIRTLQR